MDVVTSFPLNYKQKLKKQKLRLKIFLGFEICFLFENR